MTPPCVAFGAIPPGGRRQWPGEARSTASAGMACSAAIGPVPARQFHGLRVARCAMDA
ncbi:hypothetical protein AcdelDRAFT_4458 [Acidovorax delafieldii 2AN]|uniref:Uncharacterized protein n=1 Tax=Acidovorax delafieldii 2AN TaxID=573060 RepID=C5TC28_ACIDE|nr:hypothetical protein [Diaphorobacter nitroreducens]EER57970.1 hypothetical protein AcdelDRAFT_4458 [Acidovorax delafieldii 2AN]